MKHDCHTLLNKTFKFNLERGIELTETFTVFPFSMCLHVCVCRQEEWLSGLIIVNREVQEGNLKNQTHEEHIHTGQKKSHSVIQFFSKSKCLMSCQLQSAGVNTPPHKEHKVIRRPPPLTTGMVAGFKVLETQENAEEQLFYGLLFY